MKNRDISVSTFVFETAMGWCALTTGSGEVVRFVLPGLKNSSELNNLADSGAKPDAFTKKVIRDVCRYFEGRKVEFGGVAIRLPFGSDFSRSILQACREIPYGQVKSYSRLAADAGFEGVARAAGSILASNPLPLFIPCHRVIKADGKLGGFMKNIEGAAEIKRKMLELEK